MIEQSNTSDSHERTGWNSYGPVENSDPTAEKAKVDAALVYEAPLSETVSVIGPVNGPFADEIPMEANIAVDNPHDPAKDMLMHEFPISQANTSEVQTDTNAGSLAALFSRDESQDFRSRWNEIQGKFVDEPRAAVEQADTLVLEVVEQITQMFAKEHNLLEGQWKQGNDVSTEDLRKALQQYRSFFNRLVA
jgi:hypothetical protein